MNGEVKAERDVVSETAALLRSLKGVIDAQVFADAAGGIERIDVAGAWQDEKDVMRNVQSALLAVLGLRLEAGRLRFVGEPGNPVRKAPPVTVPIRVQAEAGDAQVLEIAAPARRADLQEAARAAFDTLRNAQSVFHGFVFDGAERVDISGSHYIVVAVKRSATDARYCGAAPITGAVGTASARALLNAVAIAAMGSPAFELSDAELAQLEKKNA